MPAPSTKWVLTLSIIAVSTAAPLAKFAQDVHPIVIGFWRALLIGVILGGLSLLKPPRLRRSDLFWTMMAGAFLALHFWTWFASLRYTSVLRSTVLVCLNPIWTGILEQLILKQKQDKNYWIGVSIAILGLGVMNWGGELEGQYLGDCLAIAGGLLGSCYMITGRQLRQRIEIVPYGAIICLSCAAFLFVAGLSSNVSWTGFQTSSWVALIAMAIGPQLFGHIGINYSLKNVAAASIAILLLLEPAGAALISAIFLEEIPTTIEVVGALVILIGVGYGSWKSKKQTMNSPHQEKSNPQ